MTISFNKFIENHPFYTELRIHENKTRDISLIDGQLIFNQTRSSMGLSVRVNRRGKWGMACDPQFSDDVAGRLIKQATENANVMALNCDKPDPPFISNKREEKNLFDGVKERANHDQILSFLKEIDQYIHTHYKDISSRSLSYNEFETGREYMITGGCYNQMSIPRSFIKIELSAKNNQGHSISVFDFFGGLGRFNDQFNGLTTLERGIEKLHQHLVAKKTAVFAKAGTADVVLDSRLAGVLAHEAIGHPTEADLVRGGSVAGDLLNQKVASHLVSLVDFAHTAFDETCPQPIYIDDEGVEAEDVTIIKDGVLKNFMHNRESAQYFNTKPQGNARAFTYRDEPLIRMRNTAILPGQSTLDEMISGVEDGYYLYSMANGQADSTSEFMFAVPIGYEIKNGKIGNAIQETTISGLAFDVLKSVDMVSQDFRWDSFGFCGKKQPMAVGMGGPAIKCKINIGGR